MENGKLTRIIITAALCILLLLSFSKYLDNQSVKQHDKIMGRALVTFGLVKTLNAAISTVQATQVNASPAGLGVTLGIGEVLDPLNDFVERFSWVMLVSATSLGIQRLIMEIGGWQFVNITLAIVIGYFLFLMWLPQFHKKQFINATYKLMLLLLVFRFVMPCVSYVNTTVYNYFLVDKYEESERQLVDVKDEAQKISKDVEKSAESEPAEENSGIWNNIKNKYAGFTEAINPKKHIDEMELKFDTAQKHILDLMAVFLLQTLVIPLVVIWLLLKFIGYIFEYNFSCFLDKFFCECVVKNEN